MIRDKKASFSVVKIIITSFILIICGTVGVMAFNLQIKDVKIVLVDGKEINLVTTKNTVSEILAENHITVLEDESVIPGIDETIQKQTTIKIVKTTDLDKEKAAEELISNMTNKSTEEIAAGYQNIVEKIVTEIEIIPFETITKDVAETAEDSTDKVIQKGTNGEKEVTYKIKYLDESEISREKVSEKILKEAIAQIIQKQSKVTSRSGSRAATTGDKAVYQAYAQSKMADYQWSDYDYECLINLWTKESNWTVTAGNTSSGAYGIPQALPASKMSKYGDDYLTNHETQINWGLNYIDQRYGSPENAWAHFQSKNWY